MIQSMYSLIGSPAPSLATRNTTDINSLRQGSWIIMQSKNGWYIVQLEAVFKENGTDKGIGTQLRLLWVRPTFHR